MKKLLVCIGEGIGNIIETLPLLVTLRDSGGYDVEVLVTNSNFSVNENIFPNFKVWFPPTIKDLQPSDYHGKIMTVWADVHAKDHDIVEKKLNNISTLNNMGRQHMRLDTSEVRTYLNAAEDLGISSDDFLYDTSNDLGEDKHFGLKYDGYDVVIADGYNYKNTEDKWWVKSYPFYQNIASLLVSDGLKVASVGSEQREHVRNTRDFTGLKLTESLALIRRANCVLCNDSAMYHAAAAFGVPCVVIFTFTSVEKNHDKNFHKTCDIMSRELECRKDCHAQHRWKNCPNNLICRSIPVKDVYNKVMSKMR